MGCSNCFNGCVDIISDQCVKYTGNNMDLNMIEGQVETGDSLLMVLQTFFDWMSEFNNGDGVIPHIDYGSLCPYMSDQLPDGNDSSLNQVLQAILNSICEIELNVRTLQQDFDVLEGTYNILCLDVVSPSSGTHDVLQATIDKVCEIEGELDVLTAFVENEVVTQDELPILIQDYLDNSPITSLVNNKMIPYVAYPYFDTSLSNFDINGAGTGDWINIYICNGTSHPAVPDLRGRTLVGATTMGPPPFNPVVDPAIPGNPNYTMTGVTAEHGANQFILGITHMPNHTHIASVNIVDPGHKHTGVGSSSNSGEETGQWPTLEDDHNHDPIYTTNNAMTGLKGNVNDPVSPNVTVVNAPQGGGNPHPNIQPSRACIYIMYIP